MQSAKVKLDPRKLKKVVITAMYTSGLDLPAEDFPQFDLVNIPSMKRSIQTRFLERTRDEWTEIFDKVDACVTPVLEMGEEAAGHQHNRERAAFLPNAQGGLDPVRQLR